MEQLAGGYRRWWGAARFTVMATLQMYLWIYILQTGFYCSNENPCTLLWSIIVMLVNKNCIDGSFFCLAVWLWHFSFCLAIHFVTMVDVVCKPVAFQRRNYFWRKQLITHGTQQNENCIFFLSRGSLYLNSPNGLDTTAVQNKPCLIHIQKWLQLILFKLLTCTCPLEKLEESMLALH